MSSDRSAFSIRLLVDKISNEHTILALRKMLDEADRDQIDAGYAGEYHDRGASRKRDLVHAYVMGLLDMVPNWLEEKLQEVEMETDPEFITYTRLHKKFGGLKPNDESKKTPKTNDTMEGFV